MQRPHLPSCRPPPWPPLQVSKRLILLYLYERPESPGRSTPACLEFFQVGVNTQCWVQVGVHAQC